MIDQDPPHRARRNGEEVRPILPRDRVRIDQPHVRLVNERRRLQAVPGAFTSPASLRDPRQFAMHERHEALERAPVPFAPLPHQVGDVGPSVGNAAM